MGNCCELCSNNKGKTMYNNILDSHLTRGKDSHFNLNNQWFYGKCVKVTDGDTIHLSFYFRNILDTWKIRMENYDSPELHSKIEAEKEEALLCKEKLRDLIENKVVILRAGS